MFETASYNDYLVRSLDTDGLVIEHQAICSHSAEYACLQYNHYTNRTPEYHQVSNIRGTSVGNEIVDHSDVVGASPVGAAPTTSSFST